MKREDAIQLMLAGIRDAQPITDSRERLATWERCWQDADHQPYFGQQNLCRMDDEFIEDKTLEHTLFMKLRQQVFDKYLTGITEVSEFGCGVGDNLLAIGGRRTLRGFDWSLAAVAKCRARGIDAQEFDMFAPDRTVKLSGAAFTVHALEQLPRPWWATFFSYMMSQKILWLHIEPIVELYDEMRLLDFLAACYHRKRGYLEAFLPMLHELATVRKIEILEVCRATFGNIHHMAYSVVVWKPL